MTKYIIFGTGSIAKQKYQEFKTQNNEDAVECFIDSMLEKEMFCGKKVIKPSELQNMDRNHYTYILGTLTSKRSMINELKKWGVNEDNIIVDRDYGSDSFEKNVNFVRSLILYPTAQFKQEVEILDEKLKFWVPNIEYLSENPYMQVVSEIFNSCTPKALKLIDEDEMIDLEKFDLVLVWDKDRLADDALLKCKNVYCIDPNYFRLIDVRILLRLNKILQLTEDTHKLMEKSIENYNNLSNIIKTKEAYVFGAGPSCIEGAMRDMPNDSLRIVCNLFISSDKLMEMIKPNLYVIADEDILCEGYDNVISRIIQYVKTHNTYLVIPDILAANLIRRYPECSNKLIVLSLDSVGINFPNKNNMRIYRKAYNVITALALPIGSSICDCIYISGCDGMDIQSQEKCEKDWNYSNELNRSVGVETSKIVNEENWNKEYYIKHIAYMEELIQYGESIEKKYISWTPSYIPALRKRMEVKKSE